MYRRISVPLDSTTESEQSLPWAIAIARRAACPIDLVYIILPLAFGTELYGAASVEQPDPESQKREAEQRLEAVAVDIRNLGVTARVIVRSGSLPNTLVEHFETSETDLVVMTTHDRGRLEHLILGSVAESVARHVHLPVLLIRHRPTFENDTTAVDRKPSMRHLLIPLDGSHFGDAIIPHAAKLATLMDADMTLLAVVHPTLAVASLAMDIGTETSLHVDGGALESETLERTAEPLRQKGLSVKTATLADGQPARAIVEYANAHATDIIAMTTHGRGALKRVVAGSVSEKVLRTSETALLMYRPKLD